MQKISRQDALKSGRKRYFTGKPCKKGHIAESYVSTAGCAKCSAERSMQWCEDNLEKAREMRRKSAGLPQPSRPEPGHCELCGKVDPGAKHWNLDHDHITGEFRGWLCSACNRGLGYLGDSPERLEKAAAYLRGTYVYSKE